MAFEWGNKKWAENLAKHNVDFADIPPLFDGDLLEVIDDRHHYGETRINCLGEIEGRVYAVTYNWRSGNRWIISARKANERETRRYNARNG